MKIQDLLIMAFNDGVRFGRDESLLNAEEQIESNEYKEAIKLVKENKLLHDVSKCDYCECKEDEYVLICKECRQGIEESHFC